MNFANRYEQDADAANVTGREVAFGDGAKLWILRANNPKAVALRKKLQKPFERPGFRNKKMSDDDEQKISAKVLAVTCIVRWEGVDLTGLEGMLETKYKIVVDPATLTNAPYTPALGEALLLEFDDFFRDVLLASADEENYRAAALEESASD